MVATHDYDRSTRGPRRLMPAMLIALVGGPALAVVAAISGCSLALDSWPLSLPNLSYSITWGAVCGIAGGLLTALVAGALRRNVVWISFVGSIVVAIVSGGSLFLYASMLAAV